MYLVFDCHVNFFLVKSYPDEDLSSNKIKLAVLKNLKQAK